MATEKLYKVKILGREKDKVQTLDFLHKKGFAHISNAEKITKEISEIENIKRDKTISFMTSISDELLEQKWLLETLENYSKKKSKTLYFSNEKINDLIKKSKQIKSEIHKDIESSINKINEASGKLRDIEAKVDILKDIPFKEDLTYEKVTTFSLLAKKEFNKKEVDNTEKLFKKLKLNIVIKKSYYLIQGLIKDKVTAENILKENDYTIIELPRLNIGEENVVDISTFLNRSSKVIKKINTSIAKEEKIITKISSSHIEDVRQLFYDLNIYYDRYEVTTSFLRTETSFFFEGFIPQSKYDDLVKFSKKVKLHIQVENVKEAPTQFKNNLYSSHYEFITKMFGYPKYEAFDPTVFMSFFLPLFFGFMFSDLGYGMLLLIMSSFMLYKSNRKLKILKDAGFVLFICSLSTILFGLFFGSFFGNLIPITPLIFDPFTNAKMILVIGLLLGLIHINIGIGIAIYENIRNGKIKEILLENIPILLLQVGALLLLVSSSSLTFNVGIAFLAIAVIALIIKSGVMGLMDVTGFMGTWFSYARLLALSLATSGIALGINIIAQQLSSVKLLGPVLFIFLVIVGHLFNFALNVLGSSVHSVRLHYIEFFSQFYTAGGEAYVQYTAEKKIDTF